MFSVIFEVLPHAGQWDAYLGSVKALRPELEQVPGFIDNILYRSLTRKGWVLSLTLLRDEQSLGQWLTLIGQHEERVRGRSEMLADCHLQVGEVGLDTRIPDGCQIIGPGLDDADASESTAFTLIDALQWPDWVSSHSAEEIALYLGFDPYSYGDCISWGVFDAIRAPGSIILLATWKDAASALGFAQSAMVPEDARVRAVRSVRDYGTFDRPGAPRDFPDARVGEAVHGEANSRDACNDR